MSMNSNFSGPEKLPHPTPWVTAKENKIFLASKGVAHGGLPRRIIKPHRKANNKTSFLTTHAAHHTHTHTSHASHGAHSAHGAHGTHGAYGPRRRVRRRLAEREPFRGPALRGERRHPMADYEWLFMIINGLFIVKCRMLGVYNQ